MGQSCSRRRGKSAELTRQDAALRFPPRPRRRRHRARRGACGSPASGAAMTRCSTRPPRTAHPSGAARSPNRRSGDIVFDPHRQGRRPARGHQRGPLGRHVASRHRVPARAERLQECRPFEDAPAPATELEQRVREQAQAPAIAGPRTTGARRPRCAVPSLAPERAPERDGPVCATNTPRTRGREREVPALPLVERAIRVQVAGAIGTLTSSTSTSRRPCPRGRTARAPASRGRDRQR